MGHSTVEPSRGPPKDTVCFKCGQKGHYKSNCKALKNAAPADPAVAPHADILHAVVQLLQIVPVLLPKLYAQSAEALGQSKLSRSWSDIVKHTDLSAVATKTSPAGLSGAVAETKSSSSECSTLQRQLRDQDKEIRRLKTEVWLLKRQALAQSVVSMPDNAEVSNRHSQDKVAAREKTQKMYVSVLERLPPREVAGSASPAPQSSSAKAPAVSGASAVAVGAEKKGKSPQLKEVAATTPAGAFAAASPTVVQAPVAAGAVAGSTEVKRKAVVPRVEQSAVLSVGTSAVTRVRGTANANALSRHSDNWSKRFHGLHATAVKRIGHGVKQDAEQFALRYKYKSLGSAVMKMIYMQDRDPAAGHKCKCQACPIQWTFWRRSYNDLVEECKRRP